MYALQDLLDELRETVHRSDFAAVQEVVRRAISEKPLIPDATTTQLLHSEPGLTVVHTVVNPSFASPPHDYRTWAVIGVYFGQEDNTFYHVTGAGRTIEQSGGRTLRQGDVLMLGEQAIHKIANPRMQKLVALHLYGKNIFEIERSAWDTDGRERPFDLKLDHRGKLRH